MATNPWDMDWGTAASGPVVRPVVPPAPKEPKEPPVTYSLLTPDEATQLGLPPGTYQRSSRGEVRKVTDPSPPKDKGDDRLKDAATLRRLLDEYERVAKPYMDETTPGEVFAQVNPFDRLNTPGIRARETAAQNILPLVRRLMRTPGDPQAQMETGAYDTFLPSIDVTDTENERRVKVLRDLADGIDPQGSQAGETGGNEQEGADRRDDNAPPLATGTTSNGRGSAGATPPTGPTPPAFTAPPEQRELAGDTKTVELPNRAEIEQGYLRLLERNTPPAQIVGWLRKQGVTNSEVLRQAIEQAKFRRENPDVPLRAYDISGLGQYNEPTSAWEQAASAAAGSPLGTYALNAANFLTGNTLDNLTSDPEAARAALDVANETNPNAALLGSISGGVLGSLAGEAALARGAGMAPGLARGVAADMGMGAANAAGAEDNGNRIAAAGRGGLAAAAGSLAGTGAVASTRRALTPSGGALSGLYAEGVRPTLGQRVVNANGGKGLRGLAGRAVSNTEEALQSVPFVGSAIRGAREEARQQFQRGAFNQSLREIGVKLPDTIEAGPAAHNFAQRAFNKVYDQARSGMRVVPDQQLVDDINALAPDIQTLGPQAQNRLRSILANTVKDQLSGDAYKQTVSDLGKHIKRYRAGAMGEDQALADVLEGVRDALDSAARRSSDPDAVKLLDAADAGYAKLVRIEEASRLRGGEPGEFTPAQLDAAVQKASGGVRSKAYLRGDALMQDFATQGRSLSDRLPNSGSADRIMAGYAVGGPVAATATYAEPATAALLAAIGLAYAPGVRKATTGAFAPSMKNRKAIAAGLKRIERLTGASSAAGAVSAGSGGQAGTASP